MWSPCVAHDCDRPRRSHGLCDLHRKRRDRGAPIQGHTPESLFFSRIVGVTSAGCWQWSRPAPDGYGQFAAGSAGLSIPAHRWAYEFLIGAIPDGLVIDHLCRNRACVNPWHVDPVPNGLNVLRGEGPAAVNARRAECPRGHAFDVANTYVTPDGRRQCRTCMAIRTHRNPHSRRAARSALATSRS